MPEFSRFARWILPATVISAALSGIALLVALDLPSHEPEPPQPPPPSTQPVPPRSGRPLPPPSSRPAPAPAPDLAPRAGHAARLAQARNVDEGLRILEEVKGLPEEREVEVLAAALAPDPPDGRLRLERLRLSVVARLADLRGPRATSLLISCLDPDRTRLERLLALEKLALRGQDGRGRIEEMSRSDPDRIVRGKAMWALNHQRAAERR